MKLSDAFQLTGEICVTAVGGGGKTSALLELAREQAGPAVFTTTAHIGIEQSVLGDAHFSTGDETLEKILEKVSGQHVSMITGPKVENDTRWSFLPGEEMRRVYEFCRANGIRMFVEADGSRGLPLKAPASHEPPIPEYSDAVIVVAGMTALGRRVTAGEIHRPERMQAILGANDQTVLDIDRIAAVLTHPEGGLKNIPADARKYCLLNQADSDVDRENALKIARQLMPVYHAVAVTALRHQRGAYFRPSRLGGVLMAAGESKRLGAMKQLIEFQGKPLIRHVAEIALLAGVDPLCVVVGYEAEKVARALDGLPVQIVENSEWKSGQASSVAAGACSIKNMVNGIYFFPSDQPFLSVPLIQSIGNQFSRTDADILGAKVGERRANPVLFGRKTFDRLSQLTGEEGGRTIFPDFRVEWMSWDDERILFDVDTPADLDRLITEGR